MNVTPTSDTKVASPTSYPLHRATVLPWQQLITNLMRRNSANKNARNILLVCQLTESWLNVMYVGETQTRI